MAKVIQLSQKKQRKLNSAMEEKTFTELFKKAVKDFRELREEKELEIVSNSREYILKKLNAYLIQERIMNPDMFRCSIYSASLIAEMFSQSPESYYVIDYQLKENEKKDPRAILRGADYCFLLCSFFPERGNHRAMRLQDYFFMGPTMYSSFSAKTGKMIGYCMANNFSDMVRVAQKSLEN